MDNEVKVKVKYELSDFLKFNYWHIRKIQKGFAFFLGLWTFLILVVLSVESFDKEFVSGLSTIMNQYRWMVSVPVILALLMGFLYVSIYITGKRMIDKNRIWKEEKEITINENGIYTSSTSQSMNLKWSDILKYVETKDLVVLYYTVGAAILIPKRFINGNVKTIIDIIEKRNIRRCK